MTVVTVLGARPQFIKAAPVARAFARRGVREVLVHTGQHYDANMSDVFFDELDIPRPDHNLGIGSARHGEQTGRMLEAVETILTEAAPAMVLVYGDTNSTLAGALAAAKLHIPVAHVEAGLRSFNRAMPEEINRIVADQLSDLLFAPTETAVTNLVREGIPSERIHRTGDVMYDACLSYAAAAAEREEALLGRLGVERGGYLLATVHRQENTDDRTRLAAIFGGLGRIAAATPVLLPVHPRTRKALADAGLDRGLAKELRLIEAVGYLDMAVLERAARLVVTDSGGVQKEAFFHRVPCVTVRAETEWVELVEAGWNRLVEPTSADAVAAAIDAALVAPPQGEPPALYGTGDSADRIAEVVAAHG